MYLITIIGHFAFGHKCYDGQTIKTHNVYGVLKESIGGDSILTIDTFGRIKFLLKLPFLVIFALYSSKNIIILPAQRGIKIISPLLLFFNIFFKRKIHYVVIGGWLPKMVTHSKFIKYFVRSFDVIYVETNKMKEELQFLFINNVVVMPNFKKIPIRKFDDIQCQKFCEPYSLCTFSRVSQEKGIEVAINAVKFANKRLGRTVFILDIYGQIEKKESWFEPLMSQQPDYIRYRGIIESTKSVDILSHYFMLLFPTYYDGEGFAGTLVDAMSAGLPIIATDWHNNGEIIVHGKNGFLVPIKDYESIASILLDVILDVEGMLYIRKNCIEDAMRYLPQNVIQILIKQLD